jgi:formate dehydrogenase
MTKVLCVLYDDPVEGYPTTYARDSIPRIERYPSGQTVPTPKAIDFKPESFSAASLGNSGCTVF